MTRKEENIMTCLFAIILINNLCYAADYLKEKPNYLQTCERKMSNFRECFAQGLQNIFTKWKDGVPGIKEVATIEPLFVDKFDVINDPKNAAPVVANLMNITTKGLSLAVIKNLSVSDNDYNFKITYEVPIVRMDGLYSAKAQILLINIDTKGKMFMEIFDGLYTIAVKTNLRQQDGLKFFDLKSFQFKVKTIKNVHFFFDNLFKDKALNDNTNELFNESWREIFDIYKTEIEKETNKVLFKHFKYIFQSIPANYFVADVANE